MLLKLADLLRAHAKGASLARHQSAAYAEVIDRIVDPPVSRFTPAQTLEQAIALRYHIKQKLLGARRKAGARAGIAKQNKISLDLVSTYASRWKKHAVARIAYLTQGSDDADARTILVDELAQLKTR